MFPDIVSSKLKQIFQKVVHLNGPNKTQVKSENENVIIFKSNGHLSTEVQRLSGSKTISLRYVNIAM